MTRGIHLKRLTSVQLKPLGVDDEILSEVDAKAVAEAEAESALPPTDALPNDPVDEAPLLEAPAAPEPPTTDPQEKLQAEIRGEVSACLEDVLSLLASSPSQ